jgi:hypothetical protein
MSSNVEATIEDLNRVEGKAELGRAILNGPLFPPWTMAVDDLFPQQ